MSYQRAIGAIAPIKPSGRYISTSRTFSPSLRPLRFRFRQARPGLGTMAVKESTLPMSARCAKISYKARWTTAEEVRQRCVRCCRAFAPAGVLLAVAVTASLGPHLQGFPSEDYSLLTGIALGAAAVALLQSFFSLRAPITGTTRSTDTINKQASCSYPSQEQVAALIKGRRSIFPKDFTGASMMEAVDELYILQCSPPQLPISQWMNGGHSRLVV